MLIIFAGGGRFVAVCNARLTPCIATAIVLPMAGAIVGYELSTSKENDTSTTTQPLAPRHVPMASFRTVF